MPAGTDIQPLGPCEYGLLAPGMAERLRVTADPVYFEDHAESVELWSPGNPLFRAPEFLSPVEEWPGGATLTEAEDLMTRSTDEGRAPSSSAYGVAMTRWLASNETVMLADKDERPTMPKASPGCRYV